MIISTAVAVSAGAYAFGPAGDERVVTQFHPVTGAGETGASASPGAMPNGT